MKKTVNIIKHIRNYCNDIQETVIRFGENKEVFETDKDFRNSVCMNLLQIGELTGNLPEDFREETKGIIYWPAIKGMRNLFAHNYGAVDIDRVWDTVIEDIPRLLEFCDKTLKEWQGSDRQEVKR